MRNADTPTTTQGAARRIAADAPVRRRRGARARAHAVELTAAPQLEAVGPPEAPRGGSHLRALLLGLDALAVTLAWVLILVLPALLAGKRGHGLAELAAAVAVVIATSLLVIMWQGLYRARVCGVRAIENARLARAAAFSAAGALLVAPRIGFALGVREAVAAMVLTFLLLVVFRRLYGVWLRRSRTRGRFCRPVVVVGTGDEGYELYRLLEVHPELGFRVAGVVGPRASMTSWQENVEWLGDVADAASAASAVGATGAIVAVSDISGDDLNRLTRALLRDGRHVHVSSGLRGIDHRRLRALPLAHEPLFYLEPPCLSRWQLAMKRAIDLSLASVLLVVTLPFLVIAAIAVKLGDRGPILFRQTRIGRHGRPFTLFKLRTMVPDAEERFVDLTLTNQREGGPLFKLEQDPRRTRVGRVLERTSIDEIPQLVNVLRGEMSLVGPRPALPHEVAQFDEDLLERHNVRPGITGLWQVEGRENPAFDVYRRLDLFYVENWSVLLDVAVLLATVEAVFSRVTRSSTARGRAVARVRSEPEPGLA